MTRTFHKLILSLALVTVVTVGGVGFSYADTLTFSASTGDGKQFGLAYDQSIHHSVPFVLHYEVGALPAYDFLSPEYHGYYAFGLGIDVRPPYCYFRASNSLSVVAPTSRNFQTVLQVLSEVGIGLRVKGWNSGVTWRHISNGTTSSNNIGHDYIGIEIGFDL